MTTRTMEPPLGGTRVGWGALHPLPTAAIVCILGACSSVDEDRIRKNAADEAERVEVTIREDLDRIQKALEKHGPALAEGLAKEEPDAKRATIYRTLAPWRQVTAGGRSVFDLQTAPVLFLAVVDGDGKVVVRDRDPEKMYRRPLRERFPAVEMALGGKPALSHGVLPGDAGPALLLAVPIPGESGTVGAIVAPFAYEALARRIERQCTLEANRTDGGVARAPTVRVAFFADRRYYSGSIQPELDPTRPSASERAKLLRAEGGAYSRFMKVQSRSFGLGVRRFSFLEGDADVGIVVWWADPVGAG